MDIEPQHLKIVREILDRDLPPYSKVWLFGSRVNKTKKKYSDLDLAIESRAILPLSILAALQYHFSESDLPYKVDIVDLKNISDSFRERINIDLMLLWEK